MKKVYKIITIGVMILCTWSIDALELIRQFEDNVAQVMHQSKASSTIAVVRGGQVFTASSKEVSEKTQFYIGSVSKHMTAYMLLVTLHEKYPEVPLKELLDKKLNTLFPNSALLKSIDKAWISEITLLDLLTHRSGLSDYLDNYRNALNSLEDLNKPINAIDLLRTISFDSRKKHLYSNSNYLLIGKLIEEINQDSLDGVFNRLIKVPANMTASFCPTYQNYFTLKSSIMGQHLAPNLNEKVFLDMSNAVGAGNVISTRDDLMKWGNYLFKFAPKLIRETMLQDYGSDSDGDLINLGLNTQSTTHLGNFIGHQGSIDSFASFFGYVPESDMMVIILTNSNADFTQLMENMVSF